MLGKFTFDMPVVIIYVSLLGFGSNTQVRDCQPESCQLCLADHGVCSELYPTLRLRNVHNEEVGRQGVWFNLVIF